MKKSDREGFNFGRHTNRSGSQRVRQYPALKVGFFCSKNGVIAPFTR
jgi:hypothetical protein